MSKVSLSAQIESEMRALAEERVQSMVGDTPMLTRTQLARVWGKSPAWVKSMEEAGRVHTIPFGAKERAPRAVAIIGLIKGV